MIKHCVIGVDFSEGWANAEHLLSTVIETLGIEKLTVVNVEELHRWQRKKEEEEASRSVKLKYVVEEMQQRFDLPIDQMIRKGFPASELIHAAAELKADAIIVTNQSHSKARKFFLGNVALNLARRVQVPLIILPVDGVGADDSAPVLLGTDASEAAGKAELYFDHIVASGLPGEVVLVDAQNVEGATDADIAHAEALAEKHGVQVNFTLLEGDPAYELTDYARSGRARLLIVGKRGRTNMKELPLGSTAETVCRLATNPVMVVPQRIVKG